MADRSNWRVIRGVVRVVVANVAAPLLLPAHAARIIVEDRALRGLALLTLYLLGVGTIFYALVEDLAPLDSAYFSLITLVTVGYGDISPETDAGKAFTMVYVIVGLGVIGAFITALAKKERRVGRSRRQGGSKGSPEQSNNDE